MASAIHGIACFEALDGHLNKRKPLSLEQIQVYWGAYTSSLAKGAPKPAHAALVPASAYESATSLPSSSISSVASSIAASAGSSTPATSTSSLSMTSEDSVTSSAPLFVTWNTYDNEDDEEDEEVSLRGCIGTFEKQPLDTGVAEYAIISALHDSRFPPISKAELPTLQAAVTLLTNFESVDDPFDWVIGTHGVRLAFTDRGRRYGSTYLPDVASEQGWTKDETLFSLARKSGWMGSQARFNDLKLSVTRYQGAKYSLGYGAYMKWRSWVAANLDNR